jgi:hypothetical protein
MVQCTLVKQCVVVSSPPNNELAELLLLDLSANAAQRLVNEKTTTEIPTSRPTTFNLEA